MIAKTGIDPSAPSQNIIINDDVVAMCKSYKLLLLTKTHININCKEHYLIIKCI